MKTLVKQVIILLCFYNLTGWSQSVWQWRGPQRNGLYAEKNLQTAWAINGPTLLWSAEKIGHGHGSPAITTDRLYITGEIDSMACLSAFDLKGTLLWKKEFGKEWVKSYRGSRSTPTVVENLLYVTSGLGNLACFDARSGERKWLVDMKKDLHGQLALHGHAEAPLVEGDRVFLVPGGRDTNVVALNRFSGAIEWVCHGKQECPGYNSPVLIKLPARQLLVVFTAYTLLGLDGKTGQLLWTHDQDNIPFQKREPGVGDTHANSVFYEDGCLYYIAGDGNGAVKLQLSQDGRLIKQLWRNNRIDNYMGGFVKIKDDLYSCVSERKCLLKIKADTGQVCDSLKIGEGAVISADRMLYYYNQRGEVYLIRLAGPAMEVAGRFKITKGSGPHFSHPVIDKGVLYIRHGQALMAYDIRR
jgi:outer membrane protein assembly factor BamB